MKFIVNAPVLVFLLPLQGTPQGANAAYPGTAYPGTAYLKMAPLSRYMMPRDAEISLARSAAPKSISADAEILVLNESGYRTAVKGTNGFVRMVARSWSASYDEPDF